MRVYLVKHYPWELSWTDVLVLRMVDRTSRWEVRPMPSDLSWRRSHNRDICNPLAFHRLLAARRRIVASLLGWPSSSIRHRSLTMMGSVQMPSLSMRMTEGMSLRRIRRQKWERMRETSWLCFLSRECSAVCRKIMTCWLMWCELRRYQVFGFGGSSYSVASFSGRGTGRGREVTSTIWPWPMIVHEWVKNHKKGRKTTSLWEIARTNNVKTTRPYNSFPRRLSTREDLSTTIVVVILQLQLLRMMRLQIISF